MTYRMGLGSLLVRSAMTIAALGAGTAGANEVVLRDKTGSAEISGELIGFSDGFYRLRTQLGELRLSARQMRCQGAACPETELLDADLVFAGAELIGDELLPMLVTAWGTARDAETSLAPLDGEAAQQVARLVANSGFGAPVASYLIRSSDTEDGLMQLAEAEAHVALADRRIFPAEAQALRAAGGGNMVNDNQERIVAADPVNVIVHPSNPVASLSMAQLADIYTGRVTNWRELGGEDLPVTVFAAAPGSPSRTYFEDRVLGSQAAAKGLATLPGDGAIAEAVTADRGAIGYVRHSFERGARAVPLASMCGIATSPTGFAAKTGEYPLSRPLYLYAREDTLDADVRDFFNFVATPGADGAIVKAGFLGMDVERAPLDAAAERVRLDMRDASGSYETAKMAEFLDLAPQWERLSVTLRFDATSTRLDAQGRRDLERLVDYLDRQPKGTRIALAGFTDDSGSFDGNRMLSRQRAAQVAEELADHGIGDTGDSGAGPEVTVFGFGQIAPVGCNATPEGRRANQRVEVWIRGGDTHVVASM